MNSPSLCNESTLGWVPSYVHGSAKNVDFVLPHSMQSDQFGWSVRTDHLNAVMVVIFSELCKCDVPGL